MNLSEILGCLKCFWTLVYVYQFLTHNITEMDFITPPNVQLCIHVYNVDCKFYFIIYQKSFLHCSTLKVVPYIDHIKIHNVDHNVYQSFRNRIRSITVTSLFSKSIICSCIRKMALPQQNWNISVFYTQYSVTLL